jgi:hypothetical protein
MKHLLAPFFITMDQDLCITRGLKEMAFQFQLLPEVLEVIDLAVENDPNRPSSLERG